MKTIEDYNQKQIDDFWEGLDITPVNDYFSKLLKLKVELKKKREEIRGKIYYSLEDEQNIAPLNPITNAAWRTMNVNTFGSWIIADKENNGELAYIGNIDIAYESHTGGRNGNEIGRAAFTKGKWDLCERRAQ